MALRNKIDWAIRRSRNTSVLVAIAVIAFAVIAFFGSSLRFLQSYFGAPVILTEQSLVSLGFDSLPLFKTGIAGDAAFDSGLYEETTTKIKGISIGTSTTAHFGILVVGDHVVLLKTPNPVQEAVTQYSGVLVGSHADSVGRDVYSQILEEVPELAEAALPFVLDVTYPIWWWFAGLALEAIMFVGGVYLLVRTIWYVNRNNHPIMKNLARFGDVDAVIADIEREMEEAKYSELGLLNFTESWLIYVYGMNMTFMRLSEVVWVYKVSASNNMYTGHIWDRNSEQVAVTSTSDEVNGLLMAVIQRAPWAVAGLNSDVEKAWKKDREGFIRMVDERRTQSHHAPLHH